MLNTITKYSYNDVTIVPAEVSKINSRSEIELGKLPIFTAPMTAVVDENNYTKFDEVGITPIIPRSTDIFTRINLMNKGIWVALSLKEFENLFIKEYKERLYTDFKVCIDIANGHMFELYSLCIKAKELLKRNNPNYTLKIMTGNIANPETYRFITDRNKATLSYYGISVIDYIRLGIGGGSGCTTASNVAIHYPMASLIDDCVIYRNEFSPKIIADGGIRGYADVIKALALGADYVMIGGLLAQCQESAGKKETYDGSTFVKFFGMASRDGQIAIQGKKTKTAEGITKTLPVIYTLAGWTENMRDYLKSAMSYCNAKTLEEFNPDVIIMSNNAKMSINL